MDYPEELEKGIPCRGKNCDSRDTVERFDYYGISTGYWCDECYDNNYTYRKDAYYDPSYAGERMDED